MSGLPPCPSGVPSIGTAPALSCRKYCFGTFLLPPPRGNRFSKIGTPIGTRSKHEKHVDKKREICYTVTKRLHFDTKKYPLKSKGYLFILFKKYLLFLCNAANKKLVIKCNPFGNSKSNRRF